MTVPVRQLTLFDSTCIIVGIIVGVAIYESSRLIALQVPGPGWLIGMWLLGGLISLLGALCYAELATTYPREGGDYVYLTRAYGRPCGFLFAWAQLWVVRPGSIGAMAFVFAKYAQEIWPVARGNLGLLGYATVSIVGLTLVNIIGVREGKWTQNLLTVVKVLGLVAIFVVALFWAPLRPPAPALATVAPPTASSLFFPLSDKFAFAMIFIFYAYGGWHEMAYVGAEVRNPERNILRAVVLGTLSVTVIYVLVNLAFLKTLGFAGTQQSQALAADVLRLATGAWGARLISLLICVSALGVINGQIFTGARIYYAMGTEHRLYAWLGRWNPWLGTPIWSLLIQAVVTLGLVIGFGLIQKGDQNGFQSMVTFTTPVFWIFMLLVGVGLVVLRYREPDTRRPYRVPGYPLVPILFCCSSLFMIWKSLAWAVANRSPEALWSIVILAVGLALSCYDPKRSRSTAS
jgi:amino acid transporter